MTRRYTNKLMELIEDGTLEAKDVARCALGVMSEAEVQSMCEDDFEIVGWELGVEPHDVSDVLALLEGKGYRAFAGGHEEHAGPCVIIVTKSDGGVAWNTVAKIHEVLVLLEPLGWELSQSLGCLVDSTYYRETLWSLVPLKKED